MYTIAFALDILGILTLGTLKTMEPLKLRRDLAKLLQEAPEHRRLLDVPLGESSVPNVIATQSVLSDHIQPGNRLHPKIQQDVDR